MLLKRPKKDSFLPEKSLNGISANSSYPSNRSITPRVGGNQLNKLAEIYPRSPVSFKSHKSKSPKKNQETIETSSSSSDSENENCINSLNNLEKEKNIINEFKDIQKTNNDHNIDPKIRKQVSEKKPAFTRRSSFSNKIDTLSSPLIRQKPKNNESFSTAKNNLQQVE